MFGCTTENIQQHLNNIYEEKELIKEATTKKFLVVRKEGTRNVRRNIDHYNLDATMFIDYAEMMAEDEILMSMQDWLDETDNFLSNNRRKVLIGKGKILLRTSWIGIIVFEVPPEVPRMLLTL